MRTVALQGPTDLTGFRRAARALLAEGMPPDQVRWQVGAEEGDLLGPAADLLQGSLCPEDGTPGGPGAPGVRQSADAGFTVPASFMKLCNAVLLHQEPQRFVLMYRILFRLKADPSSWRDVLHPERQRAERMAREVRREIHKMHAFVRFFPVPDESGEGEQYLAWFEPEHFIEEAAAPFFARRFANMRWAILSPRCSLTWDGSTLHTGPAGRREDVPPMDAGAELWLTYYRSIFNPARLKVAMMEKEMPRRYWANLPEAALIEPLIAEAQGRTSEMLDSAPTAPRRIRRMAPVDRNGT